MMSCPVCNKAVDPLRARHVRVVGVKVISYCSAECFQASAPPEPTSGQAAPKAASAVATPKLDDQTTRGASAEAKSAELKTAEPRPADKGDGKGAAKAEGKGGVKGSDGKSPAGDGQAAAAAEGKAEGKADPKAEAKPETKADAKADPRADAKPEAKADAKQAKPETKAPGKPETSKSTGAKAESKTDSKSAGDGKGKPESKAKADGKIDSKPAGDAKGKSDSANEAKAEAANKAKADGKPEAANNDKANAKPEKASGSKPSAKSEPATGATADAPARAAAELSEPSEGAPSARPWLKVGLALAAAAILGGVWWLSRPAATPPPPPPPPVAPPVVETPPPPPVIAPAEAHARAVEVLRAHFAVESLRVRRVAAAALGRQADPQAITVLADLLPTEQSEIAKLDIGYGLARAKDPRGLELLLSGLSSSRRDVKGEAARLLAALRDARAMSTLSSLSNLQQFRLSATEQLARLGNKQAMERLEKLRADPQASEEDRRRATIAIGDAGGAHVAEELRALLTDQRFNVKAAAALAVLRDESCRTLLLEHLTIPSLRVDAALALRRLDPALDASTILYRLMPALESAKDTERVEAAEAILLLTGPAGVAELD